MSLSLCLPICILLVLLTCGFYNGKVSEYVRSTWDIINAKYMLVTFIPVTVPSISNFKHLLLLTVETWPLISQTSALLSVSLVQQDLLHTLY